MQRYHRRRVGTAGACRPPRLPCRGRTARAGLETAPLHGPSIVFLVPGGAYAVSSNWGSSAVSPRCIFEVPTVWAVCSAPA